MRVIRSALLIAGLLLAAGAAVAERPACPPSGPGGCFIDVSDAGLFGFIVDGEGDTIIVGPFDEENDFFLFPPNGKRVRLHQIDREIDVYVCPADPGCVGGPTHLGSGHASANVSLTPAFGLGCPTSIQISGSAIGPLGGEFDVRAALMLVPSKKAPSGCRLKAEEVTLIPR